MNKELSYKTFDELLSEVSKDFISFDMEGMIEPAQLIGVATKINYDLGLRIHSTKERVLDVDHKTTRLPDDFYVLNHAFLCDSYTIKIPVPAGRHTEDVILDPNCCRRCGLPDPTCCCEKTYTTQCGDHIQVIEKRKFETRIYDRFERIYIKPSKFVKPGCVNSLYQTAHEAYIKNGFLYTNLDCGHLYINYEGSMEDEEGNLIVLDHPMINEYYEYALKERILENMYLNGEDVIQRLQYTQQKLRDARVYARHIVNTPDYAEFKRIWELNRKAQYQKYYDPFKN